MNELSNLTVIPGLTPLKGTDFTIGQEKNSSSGENSFTNLLKDAVKSLEQNLTEGNAASVALVTGEIEDLHTPVIAMEKANLSLGLAVTVRNKVISAYQEIMRMQI